MRIVETFPHNIRSIENCYVPMPDGAQLAARIWMPEGAEDHPIPAILEYIPYRKRDLTRERDQLNHPYLAGHGYVCVRVDMRGSGDSDGILYDEYTEQEQQDGVDVIDWIAAQPWCNGRVGMMGISWGGFNALQIAARAPKPLGAIITCCSSDDQYEDNMHYMGGCLLGDHLSEATVTFAFNSMPPDPEIVGERWRDMWFERLEHSGLWIHEWLSHQRRDEYWLKGSVCEDYSRIQCPVFAVGGWADGYTNAVFRLMDHLQVPCHGLIGPWGHRYPNIGRPGPAIGFLQEVLRWFDCWLKDRHDVLAQPRLRVWLQDSVPPSTAYEERPGRWVGEAQWPSPHIHEHRYLLGYRRLLEDSGSPEDLTESVRSPLSVGLYGGRWCSYTVLPDLPHDQREEDGGALIFDSRPLTREMEIVGVPVAVLELAADQPVAQVAVRLSDVYPDGRATRITYGVLNLTHRHSHAQPEELEPGRFYRVQVRLCGLAQSIPAGHRLRLSVSSSYFPLVWPPPQPTMLRLRTAGCHLSIPHREPRAEDRHLRVLGEPETAPPLPMEKLTKQRKSYRVVRDLTQETASLETVNDGGRSYIPEIDLAVRRSAEESYGLVEEDFESAAGVTYTKRELKRDDWDICIVTRTVLTCDRHNFYLRAQLDAYEADEQVFSKNWDETVPRDHV